MERNVTTGDFTSGSKAKNRNSEIPDINSKMPNISSEMPDISSEMPDISSEMPDISSKVRDINSKTIFGNPVLCSQFLRDNFKIPLLQNVRPEDIEDVSERYQTYMGIELQSDTVKKIRLRKPDGENAGGAASSEEAIPLYMISLIEHKSQVDYNVAMQLLRYMVCIWNDYEKECNRTQAKASSGKGFRYPPILPIVYYEGAQNWTADLHLRDRILMKEIFQEYLPDFTYQVIRIHDYSNEELLSRADEMSLLMLINKIQSAEDFSQFIGLPQEQVRKIVEKAPEHVLDIIVSTIWSLCRKMNVPEKDAKQYVEKVRDRQMGYLFENMEKIDVQAAFKKIEEMRKELDKKAETTRKEAEAAYKKAETARKETEAAHKEAEAAHKETEAAHKEAETARKEVETAHKEAETARKEVETAHKEVETAHKEVETAHKEAETARKEVETAHKEVVETNQKAIKMVITFCKKYGIEKSQAISQLVQEYGLDEKDAEEKVMQYWKDTEK